MNDSSIMILPSKYVTIDNTTRKGTITLQNNVLSGGAYKIRTTSPKDYSVRPNIGIIKPLQTITINVILQSECTSKNHKFMVEVYDFDYKKSVDEFKKVLREGNLKAVCTKILFVEDKQVSKPVVTEDNEFIYQCCTAVVVAVLFFYAVKNLLTL
ncbi:VAMP-associated protein involved in inositol metabolism [Trachipleistophora hominis]|uniref:VAMP-associated protein involved in inositol metabolism n=1 Tax=Trachipleistophora hominis TaxID=72359 RepID=L7JX61_TRAHO|nr:VAMP-associated protein involved in inositol metabolism [Trachipleistophora hominis]